MEKGISNHRKAAVTIPITDKTDFKTVTYIHARSQTSGRNPSISLFKWNLIILQHRINVRMCVCVYIYMDIDIYIYVPIYIYVYIYGGHQESKSKLTKFS